MGSRSRFAPEFRRDAVELVRESGRSKAEVARSLGVSPNTLGGWVAADELARGRSEDPSLVAESEVEELKRLRRENMELRVDREILRKAAAFFAREMNQ